MSGFLLLFLYFIIYSFIGYLSEIAYCSIMNKKIVLNRGFFLGPYLPIYGFCCVIISLLLQRYYHDLVALFAISFLLCSVIEYLTSYILEKLFKVRWWNYHDIKFNLNGRVCLLNSLLFGIGGVLLIELVNPIINYLLFYIPTITINIISIILLLVFISDLFITLKTLCDIKINSTKYISHDATDEIKKIIRKKIEKQSFLISRVLNAFPKMSGNNIKIIVEFKRRVNEYRKEKK